MGDRTGYEVGNAPYTIPKHVWSCTRSFCDSQMDLEHKVDDYSEILALLEAETGHQLAKTGH